MKDFFRENKEIILPAALFLIVLLLFGRMVFNDFVYDDATSIIANKTVRQVVSPIPYFNDPTTWGPIHDQNLGVYRPLSVWFSALQYRFLGPEPFYFHLISLLLHALNTVLFFLLLGKIFKNSTLSFFGALIFGIHPVMAESVAWVTQQSGLWSWFFSFLALNLLFTEESGENIFLDKKWKKIMLLTIFSFAAVFLKEHAVILPLIYILCVLAFKMGFKKKLREIAAITLPVILYIFLRSALLGSFSQMEPWGGGRYVIFLTMLKGFVYYLRLLVWPHPLSVNYDSFPLGKNLFSPDVIFSAIFLFLLILSAIIFWRKRPLFSLGIFWIFINFGPVSNFILPMKQIINERFLYFAVPGFILAVFSIVIFINEKMGSLKRFLIPLSIFSVILVSLIFSGLTFARLGDWKEEITLWQHEIKIKPDNWRTQLNYGYSLEIKNRSKEAIEYYKKAMITVPRADLEISATKKLAEAFSRIGEHNKAETVLLSGLKRFPENEILLFVLAGTYLENRQYEKSAEIFKSLREKNNGDIAAFFAILSEKLNGEKEEKIKSETEEIKNPKLRKQIPYLILARGKMLEEKWPEAVSILSDALQNSPTPIFEVYLWVAESYEKTGEKEKALDAYQLALTLFPSSIDAAQGIIRNSQK